MSSKFLQLLTKIMRCNVAPGTMGSPHKKIKILKKLQMATTIHIFLAYAFDSSTITEQCKFSFPLQGIAD